MLVDLTQQEILAVLSLLEEQPSLSTNLLAVVPKLQILSGNVTQVWTSLITMSK
jgi:hypothetical protein